MKRLIRVEDGVELRPRCRAYLLVGRTDRQVRCTREEGHRVVRVNGECHWWAYNGGHPKIRWIDAGKFRGYIDELWPQPVPDDLRLPV